MSNRFKTTETLDEEATILLGAENEHAQMMQGHKGDDDDGPADRARASLDAYAKLHDESIVTLAKAAHEAMGTGPAEFGAIIAKLRTPNGRTEYQNT